MSCILPMSNAERNNRGVVRHLSSSFFLFATFACFAGNSPAQSIEILAERVRSGSAEQKRNALFDLRNLRTAAASRAAAPALTDADELVRATAASSVVFLPKDEACSLIVPQLDDKAEFVRREAAFALGNVGSTCAVEPIIRVLKKDRETIVRAAAAAGLGGIGDPVAVEALTGILKRKPKTNDEYLRRAAARAIGQIAEMVRGGRRQTVTPQDFLPEKYKYAALADLPAASSTQFRTAVTVLLKAAVNAKETDDTRREAAFALGGIGDRSAVAYLTANLTNKDTYLAEICREALLKMPRTQ